MIKFRDMNVLIEMSLDHFDGFMDKCGPDCPEYGTLKSGVKEDRFERIIEIRCDPERAKSLLDLAAQIHPAAVPDIEKALSQ